jgi:hypothetical protein
MPFGLCNALGAFQIIVMMASQDYLHLFMEIFLNVFCVFSTITYHKEKTIIVF